MIVVAYSFAMNTQLPLETPLHDLHLELGARMVEFAGYRMPVQYPTGIIAEHRHTRQAAGLFDVSHMGQVLLSGPQADRALETLVPMDLVGLAAWQQRYCLFTAADGGILDDLMATRRDDGLLLVVNAACKEADIAHLRRHIGDACAITVLEEQALLALQGPAAAAVLAALAPGVDDLRFMQGGRFEILGHPCFVTRSGYTGEDGFEISLPAEAAEAVARALLASDSVLPIGLGARDSLRLEAGLCLYGHDIDTGTTPVEAGLTWSMQKVRRPGGARAGGFPGAEVIHNQLERGAARRRVGIRPAGRAPVREGAELFAADGAAVGIVTSGGFGPSVGAPVAMGYVDTAVATPGTALAARVRGRDIAVAVAAMPFVAHSYAR